MSKLRVLIVDDEVLARERLRHFLSHLTQVEIVGECGDGLAALDAIQQNQPDLVFLDVQMPRCSGLEVVARLPEGPRPEIVFVTAHDRFAVDAFATHAVDYLLKPFDADRLQQALARAGDRIAARRAGDLGQRLEALLAESKSRPPERLAVRTDGRVVFVKPAEILWVEAANNYCVLHLADSRRLMLRETLSSVEQRLGTEQFARINRSALVQTDHVKELQPTPYGDYVVVLDTGQRLSLSRSFRSRLAHFFPDSG